mmetsp:Transcript_48121/g.150984  ORF Transcript_48121/g.150984 Transcript_48121/m.150984 type:complete len:385 (-) Transcript_48121:1220-2374(-)
MRENRGEMKKADPAEKMRASLEGLMKANQGETRNTRIVKLVLKVVKVHNQPEKYLKTLNGNPRATQAMLRTKARDSAIQKHQKIGGGKSQSDPKCKMTMKRKQKRKQNQGLSIRLTRMMNLSLCSCPMTTTKLKMLVTMRTTNRTLLQLRARAKRERKVYQIVNANVKGQDGKMTQENRAILAVIEIAANRQEKNEGPGDAETTTAGSEFVTMIRIHGKNSGGAVTGETKTEFETSRGGEKRNEDEKKIDGGATIADAKMTGGGAMTEGARKIGGGREQETSNGIVSVSVSVSVYEKEKEKGIEKVTGTGETGRRRETEKMRRLLKAWRRRKGALRGMQGMTLRGSAGKESGSAAWTMMRSHRNRSQRAAKTRPKGLIHEAKER